MVYRLCRSSRFPPHSHFRRGGGYAIPPPRVYFFSGIHPLEREGPGWLDPTTRAPG